MLEDLLKVRFYSLAGYYRAAPYQEEGLGGCGCGKKSSARAAKT